MTIDDRTRTVEVSDADGHLTVSIDGTPLNADVRLIDGSLWTLLLDGQSFEVVAIEQQDGYEVLIDNQVFEVEVERADLPRMAGARAQPGTTGGPAQLKTPLTGTVIEIAVAAGDSVAAGQVLVVVESMKMNNELRAPRAGAVEAVFAKAGDRVERNTVLLTIA
ncbi:MAG: biotin/lipoyl-containing protein [Dehalococcoidia bacterium]